MPQRRSTLAPAQPACALLILSYLVSAGLWACGQEKATHDGTGGSTAAADGGTAGANAELGGTSTASGGTSSTSATPRGFGGAAYNQCGVAAPLPAETGQCTKVTAPLITNFDDFTGTDATSYGFQLNAGTSQTLAGSTLHVGDGSDASGGTSVISTTMVPGEGGTGSALQISNTNAANWGGLLMLFFPGSATTLSCADARSYQGIEFSLKGSSPSGRFGVSLSMLETTPTADNGLCNNAVKDDCADARLELPLPKDPEAWTRVQVPWGKLTPGIGSELACVPVTGQNLVRIVIQPYMSYPPPDYKYQAGPYSITVDNISFY